MKTLLNTLYVQTSGAYLHLDHETLKVEINKEVRLQVPLHHLGSLVLFGEVMVSPAFWAAAPKTAGPSPGSAAPDGFSAAWKGRLLGMSCYAGPSTRPWTRPSEPWRWPGTWWPASSKTSAM